MSEQSAFTYLVGEFCVQEIEHLFGWDIVLSKQHEPGQYLPVSIICRREPMIQWEHQFARSWAMWADMGDWAQAVSACQALSLSSLAAEVGQP